MRQKRKSRAVLETHRSLAGYVDQILRGTAPTNLSLHAPMSIYLI
jgi:hypothetical protein